MKKNACINYLIDWYTAMVYDVTPQMVFECLQIKPNTDLIGFWESRHEVEMGLTPTVHLSVNNISMDFKRYEWDPEDDFSQDYDGEHKFWTTTFKSVRINISGAGLKYMRSLGLVPETLLHECEYLGAEFNITRCDFSFDVIDYRPQFIRELMRDCRDHETAAGRVHIGRSAGMSYQIYDGSSESVVFGSANAKERLTIYNKKLQYENGGRYISDCPYGTPEMRPESWYRIELRARREKARGILFSDVYDAEVIFKYICDNFAVRKRRKHDKCEWKICDSWVGFYDIRNLPSIIQNLHFV